MKQTLISTEGHCPTVITAHKTKPNSYVLTQRANRIFLDRDEVRRLMGAIDAGEDV